MTLLPMHMLIVGYETYIQYYWLTQFRLVSSPINTHIFLVTMPILDNTQPNPSCTCVCLRQVIALGPLTLSMWSSCGHF